MAACRDDGGHSSEVPDLTMSCHESCVVAMHCAGSEYRDRCGDQEPDMQVMLNI